MRGLLYRPLPKPQDLKVDAPASGLDTDEEIWPGFIDLLQPDVLLMLQEKGRVLSYDENIATFDGEERWFTYTQDDPGKGARKFNTITDGSVLVLKANTRKGPKLIKASCNRNDPNAAANHASFLNSLAPRTYIDWLVSFDTDSKFVTAWNDAASDGKRFKLHQGSFKEGTGPINQVHVGYVIFRSTVSQHWLLFTAPGQNGQTKFEHIGVDPTTGVDNSDTKGTLTFIASPAPFTLGQVQGFAQHEIIKHTEGVWP